MRKINPQSIELFLTQMTLEEKVALCHANSLFTSAGVPRLGIEEIVMSDGPHGVRESFERDRWQFLNKEEDRCTYLPTATALAATWNPILAKRFGETLGAEARYRGKDIILGPGVNIIRTPLCGRNFEYYGEDPCLAGELAREVVQGIQTQDVSACVKHFVLNNQELDRFSVNVEVDKRALFEIYLRAFYAAIIEGKAYSVMGSYSSYFGQNCCHHEVLNKLLKDEWGFDGVCISDWSGCRDTDEAIFNGLDIEMGTTKPYDQYYLADAFIERAKESETVRECLDDKVRRILRLMLRVGKLDPERKHGEYNTPEHQKTAYDIAAEAMVLLKNRDCLLPLDAGKLKKILVVGPNADKKHAQGGNSSGVKALYEVTPLEGIRDRLGSDCEIQYETGTIDTPWPVIPLEYLGIVDPGAGCVGVRQDACTPIENGKLHHMITYSDNGFIEQGLAPQYEVSATVTIPVTGDYAFRFVSNGYMNVRMNGTIIAEDAVGEVIFRHTYHAGEEVNLELDVSRKDADIDLAIGWQSPEKKVQATTEAELMAKAAEADCVIYCGGLDHSFDCEGFDRRSMALPAEQDALIPKLLAANSNTIIVMTAGSPVEMPWAEQAGTIIWTWYAGMEGGNALADILLGKVCPSGKLPFTMPKTYADTPIARYGEYQAGNCRYNEGILVGYRGFEHDGIEPLFPFGHGLSFSRFEYSDLQIEVKDNIAEVAFTVKNDGTVAAKETAQVYIGDPICSVLRPKKELRGFKKIELVPGESRTIHISITAQDLSFYDEAKNGWTLEQGEFVAYVGSSSEDIRLTKRFFVSDEDM